MVAFKKLDNIEPGTALAEIGKGGLRDLQRALCFVGKEVGTIDGLHGPKTRNAWAEFVIENQLGDPSVVSQAGLDAIKEGVKVLDELLGQSLANASQTKLAIAAVCKHLHIGLTPQVAYVLATADWETNHTFEPVKEAYWLSESWRKKNLHYYPYYGRGYVQLTWRTNYQKYSDILDIDMVDQPDRALNPSVALFVLVHGFKMGSFTGRKIREFINSDNVDYKNARRCINGLDKWSEIKAIAEQIESEL